MAQMKIRGNTQILAGTITNTEINASAAIASSKLADGGNFLKKDGSVAMTANFNAGSQRIVSLADPSGAQDAATKQYVDNLSTGVLWKASVRAATTGNITLSGTQTIDGVALSAGDRVLVKDQSTASANGIYVVAAGAWSRSSDADVSVEVKAGMSVWVNEGTVNGDSQWLLTTNDTITLGTTALAFTQVSGLGQITAGNGLTKAGNTIDVNPGHGIELVSDAVKIKLNATTPGLALDANGLSVALSGATIQKDGSGIKVNPNLGLTTVSVSSGAESVSISTVNGYSAKFTGTSGTGNAFTISGEFLSTARNYDLPNIAGFLLVREQYIGEETPTGTINGSNTAFALANTPYGSIELFLNGIRLKSGAGNDFTISGANITMLFAPTTGDVLVATYYRSV